jgi:hypothetical protein
MYIRFIIATLIDLSTILLVKKINFDIKAKIPKRSMHAIFAFHYFLLH